MSEDPVRRLNAALEGRYRIERELGEGGMATVYLADDLKHERKVALKVLKPELAAVVGAERFLAEIKTTANLQHPHILPLFDSGQVDSFLFYVMPYVEGESLRERLDREKQLPVDEAVRIASNVAEALDYAHEQGVIHRDIKPANILLQAGKPVISDFGIALAVGVAGGGRLTETGLSVGTPHYMSPEQATGDLSVGPSTDIYALGCVLYEMLVGQPPHTGTNAQAVLAKVLTAEPEPVHRYRRSAPRHVSDAVRKASERLPADRFASAQDFRDALSDPAFRWDTRGGGAEHQPRALSRTLSMAGWAVAVVSLALWLMLPRTGTGDLPLQQSIHSTISLPESAPLATGYERRIAISPDGSTLVYVAQLTATTQLYRRRLVEPGVEPISGTEGANDVFFSPDGAWIGFRSGLEDVAKVPTQGGPPRQSGPAPPPLAAPGSMARSWRSARTAPSSSSFPTTVGPPARCLLQHPCSAPRRCPIPSGFSGDSTTGDSAWWISRQEPRSS